MNFPNARPRSAFLVAVSAILTTIFLTDHASSQGLESVPDTFKVVEQANSPVKLSVAGIRKMGEEVRTIQFKIENIGQKGVVTVLTAGMEKDERNAEAMWRTALRPGRSSTLMAFSTKHIEGERNILVEAVLFEDGTVWGPNTNGGVDLLKGSWDGRLRLISDLSDLIAANDETALKAFVENDPTIPAEYRRMNVENRTKYDEGFLRAYSSEIIGLRSDLKERGDVGAISARLAVLREQMELSARSKGKRIAKTFSLNDVLKIERVEVKGRTVALNDEFSADDDWIKDIVVTIRNHSGKRVVSFTLNITFPETSATGSLMMYPLSYGRRPGLPKEVRIEDRPVIEPGSSVQMAFAGEEVGRLKVFLDERQPLSQLSRAELGFGMIHFDDGSAWSMGTPMRQDPINPNHWIPTEKAN